MIHAPPQSIGTIAAGTSTALTKTVKNTRFDRLVVMAAAIADIALLSITVQRTAKDAGDAFIHSNNLLARVFAEVSDFFGYSESYTEKLQTADLAANTTGDTKVQLGYVLQLELGPTSLQSEEGAEITITPSGNVSAAVDAVLMETGVAMVEAPIKYVTSADKDKVFSDVRAIFAYRTSVSDAESDVEALTAGALTATVKVDGAQQVYDGRDLYALTMAQGKYAGTAGAPRNVVCIYNNPGRLPHDVQVELDGTDIANWKLLAIQFDDNADRIARANTERASAMHEFTRKVEQEKPAQAQIAQAQLRLAPSAATAQALANRRVQQARPKPAKGKG